MMSAIFISYRRSDAEGQAGRLFKDLCEQFGKDAVFIDVAGLAKGRDFRRVLDDRLASCGVLLAILGKEWLTATDEKGQRRLDNSDDVVRLETSAALKRDIPVIPVLVQGARMPRVEELPEDLKELVFRNGTELTHARWESDVQELIKAIAPYVQGTSSSGPSPFRWTKAWTFRASRATTAPAHFRFGWSRKARCSCRSPCTNEACPTLGGAMGSGSGA